MTASRDNMVRSFIAIPVPRTGLEVLEKVVKRLDSEMGGKVRWVRPRGIHLTLKFMGDIPASTLEQVLETLPQVTASFGPFEISMSGLGVFPNPRRPRVLWAGLAGDLETLSALQLAVDEAVGRLGLPKEDRPFSPHLTLGRVRRDTNEEQSRTIGYLMSNTELQAVPPWSVDVVNLMRTELDPTGSRHYLVGSATIGGG
ncbi:MAG: 2'-5' RNA ligase [SAR202 cluster bacterium MP-SAtl-SRR3965592-G1]|nr:MAG: 2'-5' RNA ligase [SAR202 cluster bacterium MP-SAtl-SRR3965592-G1]